MALPLGKKSLVQIERRQDPFRRVVESATLLEWLLRLEPCSGAAVVGCPSLATVIAAYAGELQGVTGLAAAVQVRDGAVHFVPGTPPLKKVNVETACKTFQKAIDRLLARRQDDTASDFLKEASWQVTNDPLGELDETPSGAETAPTAFEETRLRLSTVLWRLDVVSGRRAPFTRAKAISLPLSTRLSRRAELLESGSCSEVVSALDDASQTATPKILAQAVENLENAYNSLSAFDAAWQLAPGVLPLPAIRLEPDITTRIRLLISCVEHQLAWIPPRLEPAETRTLLEQEAGALFLAMLNRKGHLLSEPEEVRDALDIRNRLVRVVPNQPPLLICDVERAEASLWKAAFDLRRHCSMEHADALSNYRQAPLRTWPASRIRAVGNPKARLSAWYARLEALALLWEGMHPGAWTNVRPGANCPDPVQILQRHPHTVSGAPWSEFEPAAKLVLQFLQLDRGAEQVILRPDMRAAELRLSQVVEGLEHELQWVDLPRPTLSKPAAHPEPVSPSPQAAQTSKAAISPTPKAQKTKPIKKSNVPAPMASPSPPPATRGFLGWLLGK